MAKDEADCDIVPLVDSDPLALADTDPLSDAEAETEADGVNVGVGVELSDIGILVILGVMVSVALADPVWDVVIEGVCVPVRINDSEGDGLTVGESLGVGVGV